MSNLGEGIIKEQTIRANKYVYSKMKPKKSLICRNEQTHGSVELISPHTVPIRRGESTYKNNISSSGNVPVFLFIRNSLRSTVTFVGQFGSIVTFSSPGECLSTMSFSSSRRTFLYLSGNSI